MPGHEQIIELLEQIVTEHDQQKLIPLVEQLRRAVSEETRQLNAKIDESKRRYAELHRGS